MANNNEKHRYWANSLGFIAFCILEFSQFDHGYLVKNSCIYSFKRKYYNIETGDFYCDAATSMESSEFLFLENRYDNDEKRRGVMKINKDNGSWELFK